MISINPVIRVLFLHEIMEPAVVAGYARREDFTRDFKATLVTHLQNHGAPPDITDLDKLANDLYDEFVEAEVIHEEKYDYAGTFATFASNKYGKYRLIALQNDQFNASVERIGKKLFTEMFAGYLRERDPEDIELVLRSEWAIPASDRVVTLGDNGPALIEEIEELKVAVRTDNDEGGKLASSRERIISELSAGQELLKSPSFRLKALITVLLTTLGFIAKEFAGGVIGDLAVKLLEHLAPLIGM